MSFGTTPTSTTTLGANQFPVSGVASPGQTGGALSALEGGPTYNDANGNPLAPASMYLKDGNDLTKGATTDAAVTGDNVGTVSAKLRGLSKIMGDVWDSANHLLHFNLKQVSGAALAPGNPLIIEANIANWIRAGQGFSATTAIQFASGAANSVGLSLFNPSSSGKSVLIYSVRWLSTGYDLAQAWKTVSDPAYSSGGAITPVNSKFGSATSSVASVTYATAAVANPTGATVVGGYSIIGSDENEMMRNGHAFLLPAGSGSGLALLVKMGAANNWGVTYSWIEY